MDVVLDLRRAFSRVSVLAAMIQYMLGAVPSTSPVAKDGALYAKKGFQTETHFDLCFGFCFLQCFEKLLALMLLLITGIGCSSIQH